MKKEYAGAADDINCRAGLSQHICDLETDPAAAAGHDTGLSLQTCHKKHLLSFICDLKAVSFSISYLCRMRKLLCTPPAGGKNQFIGNSSPANSASVSRFSFSMTCSDSSRKAVSSGIRYRLHEAKSRHHRSR